MHNQEHADYLAFLQQKIRLAEFAGFDVSDEDINQILKPHQRDIVKAAELEVSMPSLFDFESEEAA